MPDPIQLAIIGTGLIVNSKHWPALKRLPKEFRVVAVVNRTREKAEALADAIRRETRTRPVVYTDYREMLAAERPDAVTLALPTSLNPEVTEAALAAGCHVIAEKPIAASLADGARMIAWSTQYDRVLMIAENQRYVNGFRRAAQWVAEGVIGRPQVARWSLYAYLGPDNPYYQTAWRHRPAHPGGYLSDGGVHQAAVFRMILGEVETVSAQIVSLRPDLPPADTMSASLCFANGALGTYAVTYATPGPATPLQIAGDKGVLLAVKDKVELWQAGKVAKTWEEPSPEDGLVAMYEDFSQAIRTGRPPRATAAEALADLRLIVAMLRSGETGQTVTVSEVVR